MIWIAASVGLILLAGVCSAGLHRFPRLADRAYRFASVAGCGAGMVPAVQVLQGGADSAYVFAPALPGGVWEIGLDRLSAWFLFLTCVVGAATASYGVSYLAHQRKQRPVTYAHVMYALLLAAMIAVVTARAALPFLLAWEVMAVSAYLLISFESDRSEVRRAGFLYLVLTHSGMLALLAMFLVWGKAGPDFTFLSLARASSSLGGAAPVILLLATFGFGIKAGLVPVHFWLPGAHAAAPSHVSALLSGVMIKMGIYGLLRTAQLLGTLPAWWGWLLLLLGLITGVLGVLWAMAQRDLKRVLAYSSVENIGIILLGLGIGVLGVAYQLPLVATLGFAGALLHTLNHALFKSLLFLGAGAVVHATGTRAIDRLGGLARRMPHTTAAFLLGSVAICGLPPLSGFVSEWLTVRAFLGTSQAAGGGRVLILFAAGVGLIAALAVACFTRLVGIVFLGQPRAPESAAGVKEAEPGLLLPMLFLAGGCLVLGLAPVLVVAPLTAVVGMLPFASEAFSLGAVAYLPLVVVSLLALAGSGAWWLGRRRSARALQAETWSCGYARFAARMQYTASSFSSPMLAAVGPVADPPRVRGEASFETVPEDRVVRALVTPGWHLLKRAAIALRPIQHGRLTSYLLYIILTLLLLLVLLVTW